MNTPYYYLVVIIFLRDASNTTKTLCESETRGIQNKIKVRLFGLLVRIYIVGCSDREILLKLI